MAICRIKQPEIFSSGTIDDNLTPANAPSSANLEEDLNYIRSVLKSFFGTANWYDVPSGDFTGVLNAFPIQHYTASDDPTKEGYHKDIIADSLSITGGNISLSSGDFSLTGGALSVSSATSISLISNSTFISGADSHSFTSNTGDVEFNFSTANTGLKIWGVGGVLRLQVLEEGKIIFSANQSAGTQLIDFSSGYRVYQDNEGPNGEVGGSRLWITGPDGATNASGVIIGPRAGAEYLTKIRLRATVTQVEGGASALAVTTNVDSSATAHNLAVLKSSDGSGFAIRAAGSRKSLSPINSGSTDTLHELYFDSSTNNWNITANTRLTITTSTGYVQIGSANTGHVHFYTDRPDYYFNKTIIADGGIKFWQISQSKQYRIYMGTTFPTTPQDGDIWFKV